MVITPEQYKTLVSLVVLRMPAAVDAQYISNITGPDLGAATPASTKLETIARWLVDQVLRRPTPNYFISVVTFANNMQAGIASLVALAETLSRDPSLWKPLSASRPDWAIDSDPLAIPDGRPFVDRLGFRQLLPRIGAPDTPGCVLVTGDTLGGKSYLSDFCRALMMEREGLKLAYARMPTTSVANDSVRGIAERLGFDLDVPVNHLPGEHAELERDAENLATWIARYSVDRAIPALVILDEFGRAASRAHHKFVAILASEVQNDPRVRARLRLVLIDYNKDRLASAGIKHEHYVLEPIESHHLETWFRTRHPGHAEYRYADAAQKIAARLPALQPSERMERLNNLVRAASKTFETA